MKIHIETERLILREMLLTDADDMFALDSDPEVMRYLGNKPITEKAQAVKLIEYVRQQYEDYGIGRWAVIDKKTNAFMGWAGLKYRNTEENGVINFYDLGYRFLKKYWGQGIATEAAVASLHYGFAELSLEELYAAADCNNMGSNKVLRKIGMKFVETFDLEGAEHNWYKLTRREYERSNLFIY